MPCGLNPRTNCKNQDKMRRSCKEVKGIYVAVAAKSQEEAEQLVTKLEVKGLVLRTSYIGSTVLNGLKVSQNHFAMTSAESGAGLFRT